ncbi:hypothetical protein ACJ72_03149 [Emergomyces africanus]|uniref:Heterokaryon incompatibility domain-containing protein n=1 Tax=Emergomyces africanus TaxID=1955775 RepID=A0A1B7P0G5_9EURO|nr:hypothetical protein ACJ72_03149 [Emergomyces africanus]
MTLYDYRSQSPLRRGEFRLLRLHPGVGDAELECNLLKRSLPTDDDREPNGIANDLHPPTPEPYDALSYTWGAKGQHCQIKILESGESHSMEIRPNLKAALLCFRLPSAHRHLWVDALCVDQAHQEEKSAQVSMMFRIFDTANTVCVWLGEEADESTRAMKFIQNNLKPDEFDKSVEDPSLLKEWLALSALIRRPWFSRRWIIQEIALAKKATVYCGCAHLDWEEFANAVSLLVHSKENVQQLLRKSSEYCDHPDCFGDVSQSAAARLIEASDNMFRKSEKGHILERLLSLEELMSSLSAFEASDPRDVLYAILWLARDARPGFRGRGDGMYLDAQSALSRAPAYTESPISSTNNFEVSIDAGGQFEAIQMRKRALSDITYNARSSKRPSIDYQPYSLIPQILVSPDIEFDPAVNQHVETMNNQTVNGHHGHENPMQIENNLGPRPVHLHIPSSQASVDSSCSTRGDSDRSTRADSVERREGLAIKIARSLRARRQKNRIPVDYNKSVLQVCQDVLKFIFTRSDSLDMLCRPWAPTGFNLPSWMRPVSENTFATEKNGVYRRVNADPLVGKPWPSPNLYRAAHSIPADWKFDTEVDESLNVQGFVLDTIQKKSSAARAGIIPSDWNKIAGWEDTGSPPPETFWRTLVGNRDFASHRPPRHWRKACQDAFSLRTSGGDLDIKEAVAYKCPKFVQQYLGRVKCTVWSRRLAVLDHISVKESLCLVPISAKKGDKVCILYGCNVPVVLRDRSRGKRGCCGCWGNGHECGCRNCITLPVGGPTRYELIGECYVHGMMDGEALAYKQKNKIKGENFDIR